MRPVLLALALAASSRAQDAELVAARGPVSLKTGGAAAFVAAKGGEQLLFGDTVRVGAGGVAQLVLPGRGAVLLREETLLTLEGSPRRTTLGVRFGEFLIGLKRKLEKGESFRVRTPAAVAAVRGTLFWGRSDKASKTTTYAGFGRTVAVTAKGKTVIVEPGRTVVVPLDSVPSEPAPSEIGLDYARKFAVDGGLQGVETLAEGYQPPKEKRP